MCERLCCYERSLLCFCLWHACFTLQTMGTFPVFRFPSCWYSTIPHHAHTHMLLLSFFQSLDLALKYCNYFFTSTFVLESVLKLIAFGFRRFFKERCSVYLYFVCLQRYRVTSCLHACACCTVYRCIVPLQNTANHCPDSSSVQM